MVARPSSSRVDRWPILVGPDAEQLDELVRQSPERAYDVELFESFAREGGWRGGSVRHADEGGNTEHRLQPN
jgi:hypothetical protein